MSRWRLWRSKEPLWKDEFSIFSENERYVTRRQFSKFLVLTSLGMFAGNVWIWVRSLTRSTARAFPEIAVATLDEIPVGGVKLFNYPTEQDECILVRRDANQFVAYSRKCTHLTCPVFYARQSDRLECPCHEGYFDIEDGSVLQGPPTRPLPQILLEVRGNQLFAVGQDPQEA